MSYSKTEWVDGENKYSITDQDGNVIPGLEDIKLLYTGTGGTPLSSEKMNNIEKGVGNAHDQLDNLAYDLYNIYQEQYYLGNSPTSPSFGAAKSIFFDPLIDTTTYDAAGSTALFNTTSKTLACKTGTPYFITPSALIDYAFGGIVNQATGIAFSGSLAQLIDGNEGYPNGYYSTDDPFTMTKPVRADLGSAKVITGFSVFGGKYDGFGSLAIHDPGKNYASVGTANLPHNSTVWVDVTLTPDNYIFTSRYAYLRLSAGSSGSYGSATFREIKLLVTSYLASIYKSKTFSLTFTPTKARAYISRKTPSGTSISPNLKCGAVERTGVIVETRSDPNFAGFTEDTYEFDLTGLEKPTQFNITLNPSATTGTPEVKRYGLYFY